MNNAVLILSAASIFILTASSSAFAESGQVGTPDKRSAMQQARHQAFESRKDLAVQAREDRITVMSSGRDCMLAAKTPDAVRACVDAEKKARNQIRGEHRSDRQSAKQAFVSEHPEAAARMQKRREVRRENRSN
jgi:hypothetical protein